MTECLNRTEQAKLFISRHIYICILGIHVDVLKPCILGNNLTQKDNADSGVQFITLVSPRQSLLLAKDPDQFL